MAKLFSAMASKPPWVVLLVSVAVSIFAGYVTQQQSEVSRQLSFERAAEKLRLDISHHLDTYISILRAGVGLFSASEYVSRDEWQKFVKALEVDRLYSGVQGLGFAPYIRADDLDAHQADIHTKGFPEYSLRPSGQRSLYAPVLYLEPFDWRNQRAFGYDMFSEPVRREAMERARDTAQPGMTGLVTLEQETNEDVQAGFLVYIPIYRSGLPPLTIEARRDELVGFVYAPFRMGNFIEGLVGKKLSDLGFAITDIGDRGGLLYRTATMNDAEGSFQQTEIISAGGRDWQLRVVSTSNFDVSTANNSALIVLVAGLLDSLLLFVVTLTLISRRLAVQRHAEHLKRELNISIKVQQMADFAPTALITVDANGCVDLFNQEALRVFGYNREELSGLAVELLMSEQYRNSHPHARKNYMTTTDGKLSGSGSDLLCVRKTGEEFPAEVGVMSSVGVSPSYTVCSINDISDRKQQEDLLHKKTAELEQFVYAVSHDLRSPLVAIAGLAGILEQHLDDEEVPVLQAHHWIQRILANAHHMEKLLNDLLDLSRITHKDVEYEKVNLAELVDAVVAFNQDAMDACGGELIVDVSGDELVCQPTMMMQVLNNLLANAIKYREKQRPLIVILSATVDRGGHFICEVSDNGVGIASEWLVRIFTLFVRHSDADEAGTGVGLSICKAVIERHGGTITARRNKEFGSVFCIDVPPQRVSVDVQQ